MKKKPFFFGNIKIMYYLCSVFGIIIIKYLSNEKNNIVAFKHSIYDCLHERISR